MTTEISRNRYRIAEIIKKDSVKKFLDSDWMEAVLELYDKDSEGESLYINRGHFGQDGPGITVIKGIHNVLMQAAHPINNKDRAESSGFDWNVPAWATHAGKGYVSELFYEYLGDRKDWIRMQGRALDYLAWNGLYWRGAPRAVTYYTRPWPAGLDAKTIRLSEAERLPHDWRTEKRIKEESEREENKIVVVKTDLSLIPLPNPEDPKDFVRYVKNLRAMIDRQESLLTEKDRLIRELQAEIEAQKASGWADAAAEIEEIMRKGTEK